ncbi:UNVERIFIED_CONTAM: hypothetical protein HDU68_009665 [Siphonaria sp. JEL0065]|nr:hypothetical protein HDU68_009665 [Siphonaria sp. JEL0065]
MSLGERIAKSLRRALLLNQSEHTNTIRVAVPFAHTHSRTELSPASKYAQVALLLALRNLAHRDNCTLETLLIKTTIPNSPSVANDSEFNLALTELCENQTTIDVDTNLPLHWKPEFHSHPLMLELGKHCRMNGIGTLMLPSTLSNLYNLIVRFPKLATPVNRSDKESSCSIGGDSVDQDFTSTGKFLDELNGYLIPNIYKSHQNSSLGDILRLTKVRNAGVWGSRDPSAFTIDIARPLLPFTNVAELRDFCVENGYSFKENTQKSVFITNPAAQEAMLSKPPRPDRTFASRHELGVDMVDSLIRRNTVSDVIDLEAEFGKPGERNEGIELDVGVVLNRIIASYDAMDAQVEKIIAESTVRDPPTGTSFLTIPLPHPHPPIPKPVTQETYTNLLPKTHWLHNPPLARAVLRSIIQWISGNPSSGTRAKMEGFRVSMVDYYEVAGQLRLSEGDMRRLGIQTKTKTERGRERQRTLHQLLNRQKPRLGNSDVQIEPPIIDGLNRFKGFHAKAGGAEDLGDDSSSRGGQNLPWVFSRAPFTGNQHNSKKLVLKVGDVKLWDNRFYVNIGLPKESVEDGGGDGGERRIGGLLAGLDVKQLRFCVRPFLLKDYHGLLDRMHHGIGDFGSSFGEVELVKQKLSHYMRAMPTEARHTIPCIALVQDNGDDSYVLSVPSVGLMTEKGVVEVKMSFWGEAWKGIRAARKEVSFQT